MKKHLRYSSIFFFLILSLFTFSQNETKKWYFGNGAGLDFMTSPPTILTSSSMTTAGVFYEGFSSIADQNGNVLFYTDGVTIWNQSNNIMANGTGLFGNISTSQSALIVKQPGNSSIYFVFTLDQGAIPNNGLRYSLVDMNLAAGMGSVTVKNNLMYTPSTEKLCGIKHCNGTDIWIITHEYPGNNFRANLVTASGVNLTPVISSLGTNLTLPSNAQGCMKISPSGKKLGCSIQSLSAGGANTGVFELFDFDNSTGIISNPINLGTTFPTAYSCEFSPDGSKFYGVARNGNLIYQWNLCAGNNAAIVNSQFTVAATNVCQMQLSSDGKIYVSRMGQTLLGVINNPNASGITMNYNNTGQSVFPKLCTEGLPNFVSSSFLKVPPFTYTSSSTACFTASFTSPPSTNITSGCASSGYSIATMLWNFGDPVSGAFNTSALSNPVHQFSSAGTFSVQLILYNTCGGVIDTLKQQVVIGTIPLTSTSGFTVCAGQSLTLTALGSTSYTWSTGAITNTITIAPTVTTIYTVTSTDANNCINKSIQTISVNPIPSLTVSSTSTLCTGASITMTVAGAATYSWSTGANTSVITITPTANGIYSVTGSDASGCVNTATTSVVVFPSFNLTITGSPTVCSGENVLLGASGANSFTWSTGTTGPVLNETPNGNVTYTLYGTSPFGCVSEKTIQVFVNPSPTLTAAGDVVICQGAVTTQTAAGASSYTWSSGTFNAIANLAPTISTTYTVFGTSSNGCVSAAAVFILVKPVPSITANSPTVCLGAVATLIGTATPSLGANYTWYPAAISGAIVNVTPLTSQFYTLVVNAGGCYTSTSTYVSLTGTLAAVKDFSYTPICERSSMLSPELANDFTNGGNFASSSLNINEISGDAILSGIPAGNHIVYYTYDTPGCIAPFTSTALITILPSPLLTITNPTHIKEGSSITLTVTGSDTYSWAPSPYLSCNDCSNPIVSPPESAEFCVSSSIGSCMSKTCVAISVGCENTSDLSVPNAFTPNKDGNNDEFCLQGWDECTTSFNIKIFDRWGEMVYESNQPDFCWDGIYKGKMLDSGVFIYLISVTYKKTSLNKKGNIALMR